MADEVLIAGASGFLGAHLLREQAVRGGADVSVLMRGADRAEARRRLDDVAERYRIDPRLFTAARIVLGDVSRPNLGLDGRTWRDLSARTDAIFNCAARTGFVHGYPHLAAVNVRGLKHLLQLSRAGGGRLHHISSNAVFFADPPLEGDLDEARALPPRHRLPGAYSRSKRAAERLLRSAAPPCRARIYRAGLILGDGQTGASQPSSFLWLVVKACIQIGLAPVVDETISITTVDSAAAQIIALSGVEAEDVCFHLLPTHTFTWTQLLDVLEAAGHRLGRTSLETWMEALLRRRRVDGELNAMLPFFRSMATTTWRGLFSLDGGRAPEMDCRRTAALSGPAAHNAPTTHDLIARSIGYLQVAGFLPTAALDRGALGASADA